MKIVVLMKQVPNKDAVLRVRGDGKWVEEGDLCFEVNESDGYALEEALRLKEKKGGGEGAGRGDSRRGARPRLRGPTVRRPRLRPDGRHRRRASGAAARDHRNRS